MTLENLNNLIVFLERVQVVGRESIAWYVTYQAVKEEIERLSHPPEPSQL